MKNTYLITDKSEKIIFEGTLIQFDDKFEIGVREIDVISFCRSNDYKLKIIYPKGVYKFRLDCGRAGSLEGVFVEDTNRVKALIESNIEVYFGEVLGKHSYISRTIESNDIEFISDSRTVVNLFEKNNLETGINPFDFSTVGGEDVVKAIDNYIKNKQDGYI